jgi:exosortase C (VPDSG-CTERM-specific)
MQHGSAESGVSIPPAAVGENPTGARPRLGMLAICVLLVALAFFQPLAQLTRFALQSQLYSYVLLIPFISGYLIWTQRRRHVVRTPARWLVLLPAVAGGVAVGVYWTLGRTSTSLTEADRLCLITLAFVLFVLSASAAVLGRHGTRLFAFPLLFLFLMVPLPGGLEHPIEKFLQNQSADAAYVLLKLFGTPVFRDDTRFLLPGISLAVAPECSGIRSTFVLVITSILAGHFLLRTFWARAALIPAIIVLGIFRNALRIFTIAQLCVHISPSMIESPLHHRGGPVFFLIALIPFLFLIWMLRRLEQRKARSTAPNVK